MKNNTKIRYFVGREDKNGNIQNARTATFSSYNDAKDAMDRFQSNDRYQPYFAQDLATLDIFSRRIETTFTKFYSGKKE